LAEQQDDRSVRESTNNETPSVFNAWLVKCDDRAILDNYSVKITEIEESLLSLKPGAGFLIVEKKLGQFMLTAIARVYRIRFTQSKVTFYFDSLILVDPPVKPSTLGITIQETAPTILRMNWENYANALKVIANIDHNSLPQIQDKAYIRDLLQLAVTDDLLGPANGPFEEVVEMSVRDRYLVGKLAPLNTQRGDDDDEDLPGGGSNETEDGGPEIDVSTNQSLVPSSFGITFCVDGNIESLEVEARWGRYERGESEEHVHEETGNPIRAWRRVPSGGTVTISMTEGVIAPIVIDTDIDEVVVQGTVRPKLTNGDRLVTLFLVNGQPMPEESQDAAWVFQTELVVRAEDSSAVFRRRPVLEANGDDAERKSLEMIYRENVEFAVGHGISVHAERDRENADRAVEIRSKFIPEYEVPITETPGLNETDRPAMRQMVDEGLLDMQRLAEMEVEELAQTLSVLTDDYAVWIEEQRNRIGSDVKGFDDVAHQTVERCSEVLLRLREGIDVLGSNEQALQAFQFANNVMALQRVHSIYASKRRRGEDTDLDLVNIPRNRSWFPFQLAFILLALPSLADPTHDDRTETIEAYADLLWFPTGGGKTEAYLGVAAFTMAIRRLQGNMGGYDGGQGLAVIMRYTLRLLTLQQFERASTLLCAMETIRKKSIENEDGRWGLEPFTIGLWVGQRVTPNSTEESDAAVRRERGDRNTRRAGTGTPAQLSSCPWCGSEINPGRDIQVLPFRGNVGKTIIYCSDNLGDCPFSKRRAQGEGLPVKLVDEEIYRRPPTMMIATVDKFAMMAWRGQVQTLFGRALGRCDRHGLIWPGSDDTGNHRRAGNLPNTSLKPVVPIRPPDLIIQDEFHLISGPLGTMVGLYETSVNELATWDLEGMRIRPKVIASTATVRKAREQVHNVFLRRVSIFPPHGLDVSDNFFSVQRPTVEKPSRRYMGICSPGSARPAVLIRVYVAFLTAGQELFHRFGIATDPYMTLVGYFNSLRELGGMKRLAEDDVQTRSYRVLMSRIARPGLAQRQVRQVEELTSRVSNKDIRKTLDRLEVIFKSEWEKGETRAIDVVLATNMLSVGVDITRLGLMVVNGQPKSTAEYIQATSRVGRAFPGLVCTVLTWARPRDLSHYETFEHYHSTFYKHVEAQSITPFAPRAMDRGLTGVMTSLMRLTSFELNPNTGAQEMNSPTRDEAIVARRILTDRAWQVSELAQIRDRAANMTLDRLDKWANEANQGGRILGYERGRDGQTAPLLEKPSANPWGPFTVPMSMREVEPGVRLVMDTARLSTGPEWQPPVARNNVEEGE
jgi:hypothetical protein